MVKYSIAVTDEPWTLPIDALVMSVGEGLGRLALAVNFEYPAARLGQSGYEHATPDKPVLRHLRAPGTSGIGPWLAVLATPHVGPTRRVTRASVAEATAAAVQLAIENKALRIGLPMIATGALGEPYEDIAATAVPAAIRAAEKGVRQLVFFAPTQREAVILLETVETLLEHPVRFLRRGDPERPPADLAGGVSSDFVDPRYSISPEQDRLGVLPYVSMLASVIVDPRTEVPLSVGIFGEWGSGKSFFMGLLRGQISRLAKSAAPGSYTNIKQISFNAWHYADTNIWASLGDEIFRQLLGPDPDAAERRHELREALGKRLEQRREYEMTTARASAAAAEVRDQVDRAAGDKVARVRELLRALRKSDEFGRRADALWRQLGISDETAQVKLIADHLRGSLTEADALRQSWRARTGRLALIAAAAVLVTFAVLAAVAPQIRSWTAGCAVTVAGLLGAGAALTERARSGLRALRSFTDELRTGLREAHESATSPEIAKALSALREAEAAQQIAEAQLDEVVAHIGELGRQLAELEPGRRLYSFLAERIANETYTSKLGLVSTIRKDFEQLVKLLADARTYVTTEGEESSAEPRAHRVERIVLYIDDLDRCSPKQVAEVLQAVHLLLALDLFVVVLGVDPRWLLNSLSSHYHALLEHTPGDSVPTGHDRATPEDYLEKIINIPVALPRMPSGAFGLMASALAGSQSQGTNTNVPGQPNGDADADAPSDSSSGAGTAGRPESARSTQTAGGLAVEPGSAIAQQQLHDSSSADLRPLSEAESALLARLDSFTETPRQAKRLINLYRMLRSTRDLSGSSRFLGEDGEPGDYQAVVVLLGILSFRPRLLDQVLDAPSKPTINIRGGLLRRAPHSSWDEFVADVQPQDGRNAVLGQLAHEPITDWRRLHDALVQLSAGLALVDLAVYQRWAPHVRRFSYEVPPRAATVV